VAARSSKKALVAVFASETFWVAAILGVSVGLRVKEGLGVMVLVANGFGVSVAEGTGVNVGSDKEASQAGNARDSTTINVNKMVGRVNFMAPPMVCIRPCYDAKSKISMTIVIISSAHFPVIG
jgi:hypothetical protein